MSADGPEGKTTGWGDMKVLPVIQHLHGMNCSYLPKVGYTPYFQTLMEGVLSKPQRLDLEPISEHPSDNT